jgi:nucleoside-diphosphate-sugar epimerase
VLQSLLVATLVFGVGYIGSRLVQDLLYEGREVIGFESFFASDRRAVEGFLASPNFQLVEGSTVDAAAIERAIEAAPELDAVYILAAQASAHPDAAVPSYTEEINLRGPRLIVEALLARGVDAPIVYASSLRALGAPLPTFVDERTPYGTFTDLAHLSKCYVEKLLEMYAFTHRVTCRVVRLGLTYGVAPVLKVDPRFMTAPNLFCFAAARGEALEVRTSDAIGFIHVEDAARALRWAAECWSGPGCSVFNAPAEMATLSFVAERIQAVAAERDVSVRVRYAAPRAPTPTWPIVRSTMSRAGFSSRRRLTEGLAETLDHFLVHARQNIECEWPSMRAR